MFAFASGNIGSKVDNVASAFAKGNINREVDSLSADYQEDLSAFA